MDIQLRTPVYSDSETEIRRRLPVGENARRKHVNRVDKRRMG